MFLMCFCSIMGHRQGRVLILFQLETSLSLGLNLLSQPPSVMAVRLPRGKL